MAANVQSMCNFWKNFDLQELQRELDTTATDLANRQDESDASRKRLVEQSREFKKNTPEDIRKVVAPLLKSFQGEVDSLSKRSKAAEGAFLSIYKRLIDLPDPVSVLEQAIQAQKRAQKVSDLEIENKQLRETLEDYNNEFAEVKNQEVTIKQLKEKLREYEEKLETTAEARAREKERELQRLFAEKERQLQETQLSVARKLGEAEQKILSLQAALESVQSELFEVKSKYDEATSAKSDEMDMVMADLERANERAASSEREAERLRQQLLSASQNLQQADQMRQAPDMEQALDILSRSNLEVELAAKEKEVAQLVEDVQKLQASLNKLRESTAAQVSRLEEELAKKNKALALLEEKLCSQEDYEEIKRELGVLKSMEFAGAVEGAEEKGKGRSLEVLLLEKNKTLQNENTQLKLSNTDLSGPASAASAQPSSSVSPNPSNLSTDDAPTNAFAQMVGEEIVQNYRPQSSSRSTTPATSTVRSPPETPTSFSNHTLTPTPTSAAAAAAAATAAAAAASVGMIDPRHFPMPPPSPFYGYAGLATPFHPAFMPVNMVKAEMNTSGGLDTTYVAKNVRELLAVHNIGQRLFAKHVLGLSQGTVSELLSKPKSWDKLTEKGRESYRKMHAWATDDANILALKAMSPKKSSATPLANSQKEDSVTEDRIASILSEAQQAMHAKKAADQQVASAVVSSIYHMEMSRMVAANPHMVMAQTPLSPTTPSLPHHSNHSHSHPNHSRKVKRDPDRFSEQHVSRSSRDSERSDSGENSQDMVARIYRQELEKLKKAADSAGNLAASSMYAQELERLSQQSHMHKHMQDLAILEQECQQQLNGVAVKAEPPDSTSDDMASQTYGVGPIDLSSKPHSSSTPSSSSSPTEGVAGSGEGRHAGSAFFLVRPRVNGHDSGGESPHTPTPGTPLGGASGLPESLSPLQRMQNIANSLTSRPHLGMPSNKPLRSVLPPITQEEFDRYSNINTEELVKKVKETLSQYSISQRLFGESVLGLSQGSVSDLLARPKPWHMLTQKGREPFIRMQIFLSDTEAIPKLVSSQYRIPPDKLMRSNSRNEGAHRRRKSSADERGFDSPTTPKRPRVFFTEEQKDALRAAYNQDPYPNQSTIETLASDLGVGVKTVINWFHNHRMRAKQQHHAGASSDGSSDQGNSGIKSEPMDESSNHSDMSSMSGDMGCQQVVAAAAAAAMRQVETSQWMFPQFEPVGLLQRKSSEEWDQESLDDRMDETDGPGKGPGGSSKSGSPTEAVSLPVPPPPPAPPVGVNKRKRSNPQRVYEGTQLDRTKLHKAAEAAAAAAAAAVVPALPKESADTVSGGEDVQEPSTSSGVAPQSSPAAAPPDPEEGTEEAENLGEKCDLKLQRKERISKLEQGLEESAGWGDEGDDDDSRHSADSNGGKGQGQVEAKGQGQVGTPSIPFQEQSAAATPNSEDWEF